MIRSRAAKRYAKALFEISLQKDFLDQIQCDLTKILKMIQQSRDLKVFFLSPEIPTDKRTKIFNLLFQDRVHPLLYRFLLFLEKKDRLNLFLEICQSFEQIYLGFKGIKKITIFAAKPLDQDLILRISNQLKKKLQKEIESIVEIDPRLIGGFKIQVGDDIYDCSIQTQLQKFKNRIIRYVGINHHERH